MPVKWRIFQDSSKNLRSALQFEGFVDALFISSSMAQLCQMVTGEDGVLKRNTQVEDPQEGGLSNTV